MRRRVRYVWLEYERDEIAVAFDRALSVSGLGFTNLLFDLRDDGHDGRVDEARYGLGAQLYTAGDRCWEKGLFIKPTADHAAFLARWAGAPGVDRARSTLTEASVDATDHAELVVVHGLGLDDVRAFVATALGRERSPGKVVAPRYLIVLSSEGAALDASTRWLPAFARSPTLHGILGHAGSLTADLDTLLRFVDAMRKNTGATVLEAWARANAGLDWSAIVADGFERDDTLRRWTTTGLVDRTDGRIVRFFDRASLRSGGRELRDDDGEATTPRAE